ncbi:ABC transporter substrate-binding protein [Cohnella faecalis]|uniref:Peptide ABC transporter substrate-binding protein n=1 Tax=Cohnella faecalis TaxID=2315694 RepID=A0A398CTL4_9BACL|nr:ABC transporter substrate-binding protein [Cohnella faecalis]RIE04048.1 peptide ABC transporter substrate-binding protein [Cohnella faecalis]
MFSRSKSIFVTLVICILLSAALSACSSDNSADSNASSSVPPASSAASAVPTAGNAVSELKIAVPGDAGPLNIYTSAASLDYLVELVFDKLYAPSPYVDQPQPWLAESAEQLDEFNWLVKIRSGIKWHDGEAFSAEDVKFTFEYYRDGPANRYTHHVNDTPNIKTITLEDASTVKFTCATACPTLVNVTLADLPILPEHIWKNVENPRKFTELAIGTGPYKLTEYKPEQYYKFEANKDYFMGAPTVATLNVPIIKDPTAIFNALRAGEVDVVTRSVPAELQDTFAGLPGMKIGETSPLTIVDMRVNYDKEPFSTPAFRRALALAVDRQAIVDTVLLGKARAGVKGYPHPDSPWTNPELSTPFDVAEANRILEQSKYVDGNGDGIRETTDGKALSFSLKVASTEPTHIRAAELLKKQFAAAGIEIKVEVLDAGTIGTLMQTREFDMFIAEIVPHGVADPDQFVQSHKSSYLWTKGVAYPEMDSIIAEWEAESDLAKRKQIAFKMQTLFNNQPTSIALYYPEGRYAYKADKYDNWVKLPGYGIVNKFSFLSAEARKTALGES